MSDNEGQGREAKRKRRKAPWWARAATFYAIIYGVVVLAALAVDAVLHLELVDPQQPEARELLTASVVLYFVALVVALVVMRARMWRGDQHSWGLRLLFVGLALVLIARSYLTAGIVEPDLLQGAWPQVAVDVGVLGASVLFLGLFIAFVEGVRYVITWVAMKIVGLFRRVSRLRSAE